IAALSENGVRRGPRPPRPEIEPAPDCEQSGGDPINLANGNSWVEQTDYSIPGLGNTHILRTWNSQYAISNPVELVGTFGNTWRSHFDEGLVFTVGTAATAPVQYWRGGGGVWYFSVGPTDGTYVVSSPMNQHATIQVNSITQTATLS